LLQHPHRRAHSSNAPGPKHRFNPNGSASSIPKGKKKGIKGKWRLSDAGYCSTWGQRKENCYTVQKVGTRYDVINGNNILAAQWVMDSRSKKE
jgi:hypothetical protein